MSIFSPIRTRVAVLRGGPSEEYDVSLETGKQILSLIKEFPDKYEPTDIFISKNGEWHASGVVNDPHKVLKDIDVVFNALHGKYGEDGKVQQILQSLQIPFTGSSSLSSSLAMNKHLSKEVFIKEGLLTPRHLVLGVEDVTNEKISHIYRNFMHPVIVKPSSSKSSVGVNVVFGIKELRHAISEAFMKSKKIIVEEFVRGKVATCTVIDKARGEKLYTLIPVEIKNPKNSAFLTNNLKSENENEELCPGTFSKAENKEIERMSKVAHRGLGLRHYSQSDFIVTNNGKVYILESNSQPSFVNLSPQALSASGWQSKDFIDHVLTLALNNRD
ncbi:MAG: hypothetical protein M3Q24_00555 [bacterium]|nr:hypothetical protein [bacterium]